MAGLEQAKEGDIVVFTRGTSTATGHVAFFLKVAGSQIEVLGGNQSDSVTIARYAKSRLLGIRRERALRRIPAPARAPPVASAAVVACRRTRRVAVT